MNTTKATLYLDHKMYRAFKMRAVATGQSVSALMNDAMQAQLAEDAADIATIRSRLAKKEQPLTYEESLEELRKDGLI